MDDLNELLLLILILILLLLLLFFFEKNLEIDENLLFLIFELFFSFSYLIDS